MGISIIKNRGKGELKGFSVVEVILAIGIFALFSTGITYLSIDTLQSDEKIEENSKALMYAQEGLEATRQMRDKNYLQLSNGDHGLQIQNNVWSFIQAPEDIDGYYSRTVTIDDVFRDVNGNISDSGVLDPDIKKVTSRIDWMHRGIIPKNVELTTYLSNWRGDDWIQTDCDEFNAGVFTSTETIATASPPTNNCAIKLQLQEQQSSFVVSADVGEHGNAVFVDGNYAYAAVDKTNEGLAIVDITDKEYPSVVKKLNVGGKTSCVYKVGNYVYVCVNNFFNGLAIINATTPPSATVVKYMNVFGYPTSIESKNNNLYLGIDSILDTLMTINILNPTNPVITSWGLSLFGKPYDVDAVGDYAYVGTDYDWIGFQIFDISDSFFPFPVSALHLNEEVNAVKIQGPYAFLGTEAGTFYVVDVSNPLSPHVVKSIDAGPEIQKIAIEGDYAYLAMNDNHSNLACINISIPSDAELIYTKDIGGKGTGIFPYQNYIYETIDVNNKGLIISGMTIVQTTTAGDYVSSVLDTGSADTIYNYIEWETQDVPGSSVKFQLRTASDLSGIDTATWVGSDGTNATYYENSNTPVVVSPSATGVRYVQFKAYITSDGVHTPQIESVTVNYSP